MVLVAAGGITVLTDKIIGCGMRVHTNLGPGLLEVPYKLGMAEELTAAGLDYEMEVPLPVTYGDRTLPCGYRMDMVVRQTVVLEIKAVEKLLRVHRAQLLTYLKLSGYPAGLLLNFNVTHLRDGITRVLSDQPRLKP
jgi:GxxExxY protein